MRRPKTKNCNSQQHVRKAIVSAYVILSEQGEGRISFRQSEGADFEQNETPSTNSGQALRYAQGDMRHRRLVRSLLTITKTRKDKEKVE
jgi:hypothetical protein